MIEKAFLVVSTVLNVNLPLLVFIHLLEGTGEVHPWHSCKLLLAHKKVCILGYIHFIITFIVILDTFVVFVCLTNIWMAT